MRSLSDIRNDIDRLTLRRAEVMHALAEQHDPALVSEHQQVAQLWEEHRIARARIRFGERDAIIQRARHEERLERAA